MMASQRLLADIVLDMSDKPLLAMPLLPPGYFFTPTDEHSLSQVQTLLDELIGTFEKPRYFDYDASICAHARSGQSGCNNCIDACPAEAIHSLAESIEVNPYLCQGGGICASACPTGAIRYCYPSVSDTLDRIRKLLQVYYQQGGQDAVVTFVAESDVEKLSAIPSNLLPVVVEEVASLGLDIWLAALAYGARRILLITTGEMPDRVQHSLMLQLQTAAEILCGLGHCETAIQMVSSEDLHRACHAAMPVLPPATFAAFNDKRRMMFMALDHLYVSSAAPEGIIPLSTGAPFGAVQVSNQACTLCLGCTSVCPTHALFAGNDEPKLLFNEIQCVQCGICASACPENAITLTPRLLADPDLRQRHVTLHREDALCCVNCGKPFATKSVVNNMLAKLEGHWMFQNERARRRLLMCDDCRVMDVVQDPEAMQQGFVERQRH